MTTAATTLPVTRARALFIATVFLGSFLLFLIQPLFARLVLPTLGGAPAVWATALLFYQAVLLAGYLYAHALTRAAPRTQLSLHLGVLAAAALTLPIGVAAIPPSWQAVSPAVWLIGLFALSIGPVFLAVSAQAPLMQAWYARTGEDPYPLYAASNAGSLLALIAYPLLVEPNLPLTYQSLLWSAGYIALALTVAACGLATRHLPAPPRTASAATPLRRRLHWAALAAVPSGLLISTTAFLTVDVMAMPLLWVFPLALYLLTYILAFSGSAAVLNPTLFAPVLLLSFGAYVFLAEGLFATLVAATGLVLFFYLALALHTELARLRPEPARLTTFYLWIAIGGVAGGLLPALVAPLVFDWTYEHPLLLIAAALLLPAVPLSRRIARLWRRPLLAYALPPLVLAAAIYAGERVGPGDATTPALIAVIAIGLAAALSIGRPAHLAIHFAALLLALGGWSTLKTSLTTDTRERSFYGVYTIRDNARLDVRELMHGTTLHGAQSLRPHFVTRPTSYYSPDSGIGRLFLSTPELFPRPARVGIVGLGTGSLACYRRSGQRWTFFEIDPTVVEIARDPRYFSFLARCAPQARITLGDARLTLAQAPPASFDLLTLDAFSSDAIPIHLLTREALAVYDRALGPDGLLLVHVSNRFVDLEPVVAALAAERGWAARILRRPAQSNLPGLFDTPSVWVVIAKSEARLAEALAAAPGAPWQRVKARPGFTAWTDDYASVLPLFK